MVELALFTGLLVGCVAGIRGLLATIAVLVLSLPSLAIASGWEAVLACVTALVALQVGYAASALVPASFHRPQADPASLQAG